MCYDQFMCLCQRSFLNDFQLQILISEPCNLSEAQAQISSSSCLNYWLLIFTHIDIFQKKCRLQPGRRSPNEIYLQLIVNLSLIYISRFAFVRDFYITISAEEQVKRRNTF